MACLVFTLFAVALPVYAFTGTQGAAAARAVRIALPTARCPRIKSLDYESALTKHRASLRDSNSRVSASQTKSGGFGKLLFILTPFILGTIDVVAHDQLIAAFNQILG